jgi:hypothetical protein
VLGVYETHINHTELDQFFTEELKNTLLESIGNCTVWLNQIKTLLDEEATFGYDGIRNIEIERLRSLIRLEIEELPDPDFFNNLGKTCEDDLFLEVLISEMRCRALSVQSTLFKNSSKKIQILTNEIKNLKMEYDVNANLIFEKERELARILDWELMENLKNYKNLKF